MGVEAPVHKSIHLTEDNLATNQTAVDALKFKSSEKQNQASTATKKPPVLRAGFHILITGNEVKHVKHPVILLVSEVM